MLKNILFLSRTILVLIGISLISLTSHAQVVVSLPTAGAATAVAAGETALIYDNGGATGNYGDNVSGFVHLTASPGQTITVSGSYDTEGFYDYFNIYNGNGTGGALLSSVSGISNWFTYTGTSGQGLTVQLTSDVNTNYTGLKLLVTYSSLTTATFGTTGNGSTTCGNNRLLFDNGGRANNYSSSANYNYVLTGGGAAVIRLLGTYNTQATNDVIRIYNGAGTGGTLLASYSGNMNFNTANTVIDFTSTAGQTITVQFQTNASTNRNGFEIAALYSGPCVVTACSGAPTGGTSSSATSAACSGVNFTVSNTGQTAGTGITYVWQSGPSNTGPWTNIGTASATYTALTANQTAAKYYRLLTTCTNSSTSTGSTPTLVSMGGNCTCLPYTIIVPTYTADEDIGNVTVGSLNNTSTCTQTGTGPASSINLFSNYSGSGVTVPNLQQGSSTSFSLTSITCGGNYDNGFQIYIDWNQNGNFNDVGEQMYSSAVSTTGPHTETGTFTVPLTATLGSTRMRVVCVETTFPDATNYASTGYLWGETEDYCVNITAAPPCTGTPTSTAAASPSTMCGGNTSTLSLTGLAGTGISYQWQSGTSATGPWSNITGATGGTYTTPTLSSTSYFRCNVTCSGSGITSASSVTTVTVTPAPSGATLSNPLFAGILDCTGYSNTMSNVAGACIGDDLAAGTNQPSEDIFYFFNLSNANNFNAIVNMSHCGSGFDTYLHLLTSAGGLIVENDDNGPLCGGTASSIQATLAPGFYYLVSEGFGSNSGNINTQIQIAPITGTGSIAGLTAVCLPSTNTYTVSGLTNITGAIWTVPAGATIVSGQGTTSISVSFPSGAVSGNITCVPYNGPCSSATLSLAIATSSPAGDPSVSPTGQWNVYAYNAGDATGGSGAWTTNYAGYYSISNLSFDTQPGQTNSTAQSWVNTASPSSAAGYLGCAVQVDNHSYIFKRTGVPTCGTYRIDALNHDDMAILFVNGAEVWRHNGCCDVHLGVWTGYLDASSVIEYRVSEGAVGSNAGLAFTQIATTATLTGTNPPSCLVNGTITISNVTGGACNLLSSGFGSLPSSTAVSGSAAITGEECVITTAANSLTGAWGYTPLIRPNAFGLIYNQFIGTGTGADGMSFSYGPFAYNTGGSETGWNTGLVVSFDTYNNPTGTTNSRIYLSYNGVEFASNTLGAFNLRTGTYIPVSINVNQAGQLTLVVNGVTIFNNTAVPAAYLTANKSTWNFAFSARTGGFNDVHKVDNVNLYADNYYEYSIDGTRWQTSTTFSAPVGTYAVQARPICGTSCTTALGTVTLSSATLDWANTQYPASGEICYGGAFDVYGQVYEPGVTPGAGAQGAGIAAEVGVFTSNTNPSTWPTTAWSSATFNSGGGGANNDEYMANIGSSLTAGTYYYAFRYSLGGCAYQYGGYSASGGGFWDGTTYSSGQLIVRQVVPAVAETAPINCNGGMADISVTGTGGVAPYVGETTATLVAGTYTYTLTDVNGCVGTTSYTVTEPALLVASVSGNNVLCNGGTTSVTVTASGGTAPYSGTGVFTVSAGTYSYTVTDANGCTSTASITITEPTTLTTSSVVGTGIICNGGSTTVTVSANGGNAPYVGTGTFTALAGSASYTVTDANGCSSITSITISEPTAIVVSYTATNISCTGGSAVVTISATGGTGTLLGTGSFVVTAGTYVYTVTDGNGCAESISVVISEPSIMSATASATDISCYGGTSVVTVAATGGTGPYTGAGNFTVSAGAQNYTVTDANGCTASASVTVTQPSQLIAASTATPILCNGGTSTVTVTATGGTTPYGGIGTYTVPAGTHSYTVTDTNGCTATTSITVTEPTILTASSTSTSISCNGGTATVTVTGNGGTGPYTGTGNFTVSAGTHTYTVTDANGCTATTSITVTEPTLLTASITSTPILCNGGTSVITVSAAGGTGPYIGTGNYNVTAGPHAYTVYDANLCITVTSTTITEPSALTASSSATSISCFGGTATVTVTGNGGTGPYTGTGNFTVSAGTHTYTVTDANGCTATTSITVTEPTILTASSTSTSISCNGGTATVTVTAAGGTGPYSGTGSFSVVAGTYSYTITDANGCSASTSITVTQPSGLTASISSSPVLCNGGNSIITVSASGGTGPYTGTGNYTVSVGSYSYTVTDANGCTTSTSTTITEPSALTASSSATSISCFGGTAVVTVTATGGTTPYTGIGTYTVSAGTHSYTVTDVNGCTSSTTVIVTEPALVNAPTGAASQTFCSTLNSTIASIQVTGTSVQWYASNTGGPAMASTTLLVTGTTYYATQTIAGCESPSYLAVTVTIPVASTYYADADGDGFGNASVSQLACVQPTGYLLNNTDCDDAVATTYPGATELCNSVDDNCSGFVDEGCPSTIAGEEPFNSLSAPSAMYSYCSSFYSTLAGAFPSTLAQSTCVTGEDRWYNFTTLSTGVTIFIGSNANDIVIELQDANGNLIDVENSVLGIGTEVLTKTGLTLGAMYRVGIRNYNSNAQAGGQFSGCIRHLRAGGSDSGTSASWPSTIGMCNVFKAAYCGGTGVQYRYTWTGLTGIAAGQVYTKTQTSDYLTLTSVTPMLPAGCMYNVLVTAIYTIPNGAGVNEVFEMPASTPTTITISANPLTSLRTSDQCASGPRYRGAVVASLPWVCGVTNWRWRFTEVNPLNLQTAGLPIEQNRGAASNYITLTSISALQYGKTYAVQTAPIYSYTGTNYQWGPVSYLCIIGSAGMVVDASQDASQDSEKDAMQGPSEGLSENLAQHLSENLELELSVYPNPTHGDGLTLSLSGITSDNVQVKVYDALGRKIESKRFAVDGTLQTTLNFKNELSNGLYILEVTNEDVRRSVRFMVEQ